MQQEITEKIATLHSKQQQKKGQKQELLRKESELLVNSMQRGMFRFPIPPPLPSTTMLYILI